jgi:hypothetical protein
LTAANSEFQVNSLSFGGGSGGSVTNSTINGGLAVAAGITPVISNNIFTGGSVACQAEYFPSLLSNTFAGTSSIHIEGGTVDQNMTWGVLGTVNHYELDLSNVTVASSAALTLGPDVSMTLRQNLIVDGSLYVLSGSAVTISGYQGGHSITVNGSMTVTDAAGIRLSDHRLREPLCFKYSGH